MQSVARSTPAREHIAVWRQDARLMANEELYAWRDDAEWRLTLADAEREQWPGIVTEQSRLDALAVQAAVTDELSWRESKGITKPVSSLGWDKAFLDNLKAAVRVEDEIGRVIRLRKRGASLIGMCPFHAGNSPSLVVWPDSQRWRCFGCGVAGDVLAWTQASARMSFRESVHYLAAMAGVDLPKQPQQARHPGRRVVTLGGR